MAGRFWRSMVICFEIAGLVLFGIPLSVMVGLFGFALIYFFTMRILVKEVSAKWSRRAGENAVSGMLGKELRIAWLRCLNAWLRLKKRRLEAKLAKQDRERARAVANLEVTVIDPKVMALELQKSITEGRKPNWSN